MKVTINKNQRQINLRNHTLAVIEIAKDKANMGIDEFTYPTPNNIDSVFALKRKVEEETEGTVWIKHGGLSNKNYMVFRIG